MTLSFQGYCQISLRKRKKSKQSEKQREREAVLFDCFCVGVSEAKEKLQNVNFSPFSAFLWTLTSTLWLQMMRPIIPHTLCLSKTVVSVLSVDFGCQHTHSPGCIHSTRLPCRLLPLSAVGTLQQKPLGYIFCCNDRAFCPDVLECPAVQWREGSS